MEAEIRSNVKHSLSNIYKNLLNDRNLEQLWYTGLSIVGIPTVIISYYGYIFCSS